jgi:hypothetical protein
MRKFFIVPLFLLLVACGRSAILQEILHSPEAGYRIRPHADYAVSGRQYFEFIGHSGSIIFSTHTARSSRIEQIDYGLYGLFNYFFSTDAVFPMVFFCVEREAVSEKFIDPVYLSDRRVVSVSRSVADGFRWRVEVRDIFDTEVFHLVFAQNQFEADFSRTSLTYVNYLQNGLLEIVNTRQDATLRISIIVDLNNPDAPPIIYTYHVSRPEIITVTTGENFTTYSVQISEIVPPLIEQIHGFSSGLAAARYYALWGFLNYYGEWEIPPVFSTANSFHGETAWVSYRCTGRWINRAGEQVYEHEQTPGFPPQYGYTFTESYTLVNHGGTLIWDNSRFRTWPFEIIVGGTWFLLNPLGETAATFHYPSMVRLSENHLGFVEEVTFAEAHESNSYFPSLQRMSNVGILKIG